MKKLLYIPFQLGIAIIKIGSLIIYLIPNKTVINLGIYPTCLKVFQLTLPDIYFYK